MEMSGQPHVPRRFNPEERVCVSHWNVGWVGPRASLDVLGEETNVFQYIETNVMHFLFNFIEN
jgi:hypothetical protein